ncbi:hypothetical protein [Corynebacterium riegelii]|uniref:hypothetical protein n=1 Tax=Corynebacterium riegelii TaxID=156976 RepID=UPI00191E3283|nr:hypothetical protein [Corynebacterium riegelii]QQU83820.1 hypothetical protein I6I71_10740 [Corynebacterium riegelii]
MLQLRATPPRISASMTLQQELPGPQAKKFIPLRPYVTKLSAYSADTSAFARTCFWFAKHKDTRGPCKHVLAARAFRDSVR